MKIKLHIIILLLISQNVFCQKTEKKEIKPIYIDKCTNQVVEIKRDSNFGFKDYRVISGLIEKDDWKGQFYIHLDLSTKYDTLYIPKILKYNKLNIVELPENRLKINDDWTYKKCDIVCDGFVTEYDEIGNKFFEGKFKNGKPIEIKEFDKNGMIANHQYFKIGELNYYKIEYFDELGKLTEYKITKKRKNKTISKTYDVNGKLIKREVEKFDTYENI